MRTFTLAAVSVCWFIGGLGLGLNIGLKTAVSKLKPEVRYIYVHDMAARAGKPTCPRINSGSILKKSEAQAPSALGPYYLVCEYTIDPNAKLPLRKM